MKIISKKLNHPWAIQSFVSALPYNPSDFCRSAEQVFKDQKAHCMEGALAAAWALEKLGHEPQLLHFRAHRDDDHAVALYKQNQRWGAVGKSNTTLLAWRPAIYRSIQDLVHSYYPFYFNTKGQMSLYAWAGPVKLRKYNHWNWRSSKDDIGDMSATFYDLEKEHQIMAIKELEKLPKANPLLVKACLLGANQKGLYQA
jgi:hypothetical protein